MRYLAVCGIVIALAALSPALAAGSFSAAAWGLGTLLLLAFIGQQVAERLGLPPLTGWLVAGFAAGAGGLRLVVPAANPSLLTVQTMALLWLAFQVGLGCPRLRGDARFSALLGASTLLTHILVSAALAASSDFGFDGALLLGALACIWGPVVLASLSDSDTLRRVSITGGAVSLALVGVTLIVLYVRGAVGADTLRFVSMLTISCVAGGLSMELMWRLGILSRRGTAILGMFGVFGAVALLLPSLELYALPFGLCAGLVLSHRQGEGKLVSRLFESGRPFAAMVFFTLAAASLGAHTQLWPLAPGLPQLVVCQLVFLLLLRGLAPAVWFPDAHGSVIQRYAGLLLIPKGALLFELIHGPGLRLPQLVDADLARLLYQLVAADLLVLAVGFTALVALLQRLVQPHPAPSATD